MGGDSVKGGGIGDMDPGDLLRGVVNSETGELADEPSRNWQPPTAGELNNSIDVFEVTDLIGRGGMGAVYHARQVTLGRDVAIKILPKELSTGEVFAKRFRREARSLAMLEHPGIVAVYDFGQTMNGILYLVMEFVDGPHLGQWVKIARRGLAEKFDMILQVCESLGYAHRQGFIHRDLKPGNVLVNSGNKSKLVDFGLAKLVRTDENEVDPTTRESDPESIALPASASKEMLEKISFEIRNPLNAIIGYSELLQEEADAGMAKDLRKIHEAGKTMLRLISERINRSEVDLEKMKLFLNNPVTNDDLGRVTASGAVVGTGDYMAPEQFDGHVDLDPRADIYSLGVVLYELLTGTRPRGRWKHPSEIVDGLDPRVDYIIDKALEPDLEDRFQTVDELRERLLEVRERLNGSEDASNE